MNGRALPLGLLALLIAWLVAVAGSSGARRRAWIGFLALALVVLLWAACGGGGGGGASPPSSGTPAGTYTLTVTGTSGSLSHNTTLKLTVQ